jgi:hypothetical protein
MRESGTVEDRDLDVARLVPLGQITAAEAIEPNEVERDRHRDQDRDSNRGCE